ncbi:MAG: phosphatase PAP2 family protein [Alphaproteobacteria bacterium]|nr:phosphatase PAP2 family protein [Alphaproteobacteria bacterium]
MVRPRLPVRPPAVTQHLPLALDQKYADALMALLQNGPGHIVPVNIKGLIGFPSFHTFEALLIAWYARELKRVRWAALAINLGVIVSTPIQGGHHVVDLLGGAVVAAAAIALTAPVMAAATRMQARGPLRLAGEPVPAGE